MRLADINTISPRKRNGWGIAGALQSNPSTSYKTSAMCHADGGRRHRFHHHHPRDYPYQRRAARCAHGRRGRSSRCTSQHSAREPVSPPTSTSRCRWGGLRPARSATGTRSIRRGVAGCARAVVRTDPAGGSWISEDQEAHRTAGRGDRDRGNRGHGGRGIARISRYGSAAAVVQAPGRFRSRIRSRPAARSPRPRAFAAFGHAAGRASSPGIRDRGTMVSTMYRSSSPGAPRSSRSDRGSRRRRVCIIEA